MLTLRLLAASNNRSWHPWLVEISERWHRRRKHSDVARGETAGADGWADPGALARGRRSESRQGLSTAKLDLGGGCIGSGAEIGARDRWRVVIGASW
jgi:hypothetical protein